MEVKVYSFDLWNTLIKSNPEFRKKRIKILQEFCDHNDEYINNVINDVKKDCDVNIEKYGLSYTNIDVYNIILTQLNIDVNCIRIKNKLANMYGIYDSSCIAKMFSTIFDELFLNHLPILDNDTISTLSTLKNNCNKRLILSSNTVLISGNTLRLALDKLEILKYFDDFVFSDEIYASKPSPLFFKHVQCKAMCINKNIMHIGDNFTTDFMGSTNFGMQSYLVNGKTATQTLKTLVYGNHTNSIAHI